ncbi:MAG: hypothetical protein D6785_07810 [Planctomycetota bacterium]|nr:MAG: hypothetical protein D6785_07810 [Planctomycetota bacterium]
MAALTDNLLRTTKGLGSQRFIVKNGSTVYAGSFVALERATGHIIPLDSNGGQDFVGIAQEKVVGDGSADCLVTTEGFVLHKVSVTGVSAQTDVRKLVYATSDNDLTINRPSTNAIPIGRVLYWYSSTDCDVQVFSMEEAAHFVSKGKRRECLGTFPLSAAAGDVITELPLVGSGKISKMYIVLDGDGIGTGADVTWKGQLGPTGSRVDITGLSQQILLADAQTQGKILTATATGANEFDEGAVFSLVATVTTGFTGGEARVILEIDELA